jgi:hypothetical protein
MGSLRSKILGIFGIHAYESDGTGQICLNVRATAWRLVDLADT